MQTAERTLVLLASQEREWRARFPGLINRVHQTIVSYLCTRGRAGVPVRQLYGATKEQFLLDDATVRERVDEIIRQGLCESIDEAERLSGRTIIAPNHELLIRFDAYVRAVLEQLHEAVDRGGTFQTTSPQHLTDRERQEVLAVFDRYAECWLESGERFLADRGVSPARRTEARRRLAATSYWTLLHRAMEHSDLVRRGLATELSLAADQLAASVLDVTGQSFQTIREHTNWLITQGFLDRHPGRALRISLADAVVPYFDQTLRQTLTDIEAALSRLRPAWVDDESALDPAEQTIRLVRSAISSGIVEEPPVHHWLEIVVPVDAIERFPLPAGVVLVGRTSPAEIVLRNGAVSRTHCRIEIQGDLARITDLGSTNGTYVDDDKVVDTRTLRDGMIIRIGPYELAYRYEPDEGLGTN